MAPDLIGNAAAWVLAGVFAAAVVHKLGNGLEFRGVLEQYRILPVRLVPLAAPVIVLLEGCACLALAFPSWRLTGAWLAGGLLLTYSAAISLNLHVRGRTALDCGCGGAPIPLSGWLLLRNVLLLALVPLAALPTAASGAALAIAAAIALFFWLAYGIGNQLLANRASPALAALGGMAGTAPDDGAAVRRPRGDAIQGRMGTAHA